MASKKAIPWFKLQTGLIHAPVWQDIYLKYGSHGMGVALLTVSFIAENEGFKCHVDKLSSYCRKFLVEDEEMLHFILHESGLFSISRSGFISSEWLDESVKQYVTRSEGAKEAASKKAQLPTQLPGQLPTQLPDTEIRSKKKEERTNILVVQDSNENLSTPVVKHPTISPSKKILKSKPDGFFIGGEKFESIEDEKLHTWINRNVDKFVQMQTWLTPEIVYDAFRKFFITYEAQYTQTWAGLNSHFSSYCKSLKKAEYINFKAPEKSKQWHAANSLIQELRKNPTSNDEFPFG